MQSDSLIHFNNSAIHGTGGFARVNIPAGARLIEYLGRKIDKAESLRQCELDNPYIFSISEEFNLDGNVDWNPARLLNHSCSPNAEAQQEDDERIWIVALRDIAVGEEITFNYNYDLQDYREHPCQCGSSNCVGFIIAEEFFDAIRMRAI
jgi:SET domain-containing protein